MNQPSSRRRRGLILALVALTGLPACSLFEPLDPLERAERHFDRHARQVLPRDSFDVLDDPQGVPAAEAETVRDDEFVLGFAWQGEAKAYPIGMLGESELFNDVVGGLPITGSW